MATTYSQLSYGSHGSDVKTLQELLNQNGYSLDVDGIFGSKTQEAVKDYQTKNNLAVDGIAGNETWGSLSGGKTSTGSTSQAGAADMNFSYGDYQQSETVQQAYELLQQQMANKPGAYQSQWADQISGLIDQITNRDKFSYDLNGDALYQQYKDQYTQQGKMAMMDTMGQAQAMTGGYGNSYAQAVGQQAYQGYLQKLNEVVPELYGMALDQYNQEGQDLLNQYSLLASQDEQAYGRYRDEVSEYYTQLQQMYDQYNTERDYDYGMWADGRDFAYGQYSDDRAYAYQQERDKIADEQWQKEYEESVRRWNHENKITTSSTGGSSSSSGNGSGNGSGGQTYNNGSYSEDFVKRAQAYIGVTQDGKWGAASAAKAKEKGFNSLAEVIAAIQGRDNPGGSGVSPTYDKEYTEANNAAQDFMKNLPYLYGGGDVETWNRTVAGRVYRANQNGSLSDKAALIVIEKLGLEDVVPDDEDFTKLKG